MMMTELWDDLYIYLYAYTNKVSEKISSKSVFFLLLLLLFTTFAHARHIGDTSRAETTSVAGEHRESECGEQEMEQQAEH